MSAYVCSQAMFLGTNGLFLPGAEVDSDPRSMWARPLPKLGLTEPYSRARPTTCADFDFCVWEATGTKHPLYAAPCVNNVSG